MRRIEEILKMPIITVQEGTRLGTVSGAELDMTEGRVAYIRYRGEGRNPEGLIPWSAIRSIGGDTLTVTSASEVLQSLRPQERETLAEYVGDRPVVTEGGTRIGTVSSYAIDEETGRILSYHVEQGGLIARLTNRGYEFPHEAIRAFGKDAIVVAEEVIPEEAA